MSVDKFYISHYRARVQERFLLGAGDGKLRQREFEYLAEQIEQTSGIRLSLSTLKRIWREDQVQLPHPSTLNALVSILDYSSWADFKKSNIEPAEALVEVPSPSKTHGKSKAVVWIAGGVILLLIGFFVMQAFNSRSSKLILPELIPFNADKTVTVGVPNTVEFTYDVSNIEADSFFIQQSWDPRNKIAIDPSKHYLSTIYYLPGFHRAKLIVNDSIVARTRLHIKTQGWTPILEYADDSRKPFYLDTVAGMKNGELHLTEKFLDESGINTAQPYRLHYYNIRDFGSLMSDNFTLDTDVKMDVTKNIACPFSQVLIVTEEDIFFMQMSERGCVGELGIQFGEAYQPARENDLSAFGRNMYEWQHVHIESLNKKVTISLNDSVAHEVSYQKDFGKVVGVVFTFNSPAAMRNFRLQRPSIQ